MNNWDGFVVLDAAIISFAGILSINVSSDSSLFTSCYFCTLFFIVCYFTMAIAAIIKFVDSGINVPSNSSLFPSC